MANEIDITVRKCCSGEQLNFVVADTLSAVTTGSTVQITLGQTTSCYDVLTLKSSGSRPNAILVDVFTSCEECLSGITTAVSVMDCIRGETYFIDINTFTTLPTIGDSYYLSFVSSEDSIKTLCATIKCFVTPRDGDFINSLTSISDSYTGCTECLINNITTYQVNTCLEPTTSYYITFPLGFNYTNYVVTFIDSFGDIQCGIVDIIQEGAEISGTLVSVLGTKFDVTCDECLAISNEKRIITNCLTRQDEVVWGSVFYEGAEVTNLSTTTGCFEVGDLTESAVTITTFLDYNPQPDCQECIQCDGIDYYYSSCTENGPIANIRYDAGSELLDGVFYNLTGTTDGNGVGAFFNVLVESGSISNIGFFGLGIGYQVGDTISISSPPFGGSDPFVITVTEVTLTGIVRSYQYVNNAVGKTFFVPQLNSCVEITLVANPSDAGPNYYLYSFDVFDNCPQCESEADNFYIWKTTECGTGSNYIVVLNSNSFTTGDYVKVKRGTIDFQCHELISPYDFITDGNLNSYISNTTSPFNNCTSCNRGTLIGTSIVKCGGGGQQFVNIPIDIWNTMAYSDSQLVFVTQNYGQCYILLNTCPLEPNYTTINPVETYYNCIQCDFDNTRFPRSGGTETFLCLEICTPSGTTVTSVSVPHPVWTDGYGTAVTQLGMVVIGGPDGLNS